MRKPRTSCHAPLDLGAHLAKAGLRVTRQRLAIAGILFDGVDKHLTAESVHAIGQKRGATLSLATVYNTLNQFTEAGILRRVRAPQDHIYFDTRTDNHHHFYHEKNGALIDIYPPLPVQMPKLPRGTKLEAVDVIIRLRD